MISKFVFSAIRILISTSLLLTDLAGFAIGTAMKTIR